MQLEKIITLANATVRLRFLAMERSLRAVGCNLPLLVIPYDERKFDLPNNCEWWIVPEITEWLTHWKTHPMMRKYQCLTVSNFQFVDSDVIFLRNPQSVLTSVDGFVTSCGHWHNPNETVTATSLEYFKNRSTTWQKSVFNAGQWACSERLFGIQELKSRAESQDFSSTCLTFPYHEQPGVNLLVASTSIPVHNLTLPPHNMQSTWAGDYIDADFERFWVDEESKPYIIHWAGTPMWTSRSIDNLFLDYLTPNERTQWALEVEKHRRRAITKKRSWRAAVRRLRDAIKLALNV
jgi:hypothetical protein